MAPNNKDWGPQWCCLLCLSGSHTFKHRTWLVGYVWPHVGPLGWLVPHCLPTLSPAHEGSSQAPGST